MGWNLTAVLKILTSSHDHFIEAIDIYRVIATDLNLATLPVLAHSARAKWTTDLFPSIELSAGWINSPIEFTSSCYLCNELLAGICDVPGARAA